MGWSEWVQSDDYYAGTSRTEYEHNYGTVTGTFSNGAVSGGLAGAGDFWLGGYGIRTFTVATPTTAWVTDRDWSPPELDALDEGTDYATRPDRAPGDPDEFIEYETTDPNEFVEWDVTGHPSVAYHVPTLTANGGAAVSWSLEFIDDFPAIDVGMSLPAGTAFAAGSTTDTLGTTYADSPAPASVTDPFGYVLRFATDTVGELGTRALVTMPSPVIKYRMPRWRYWTAIESKVRQVHLDDGRGITPPRARGGSSRYATNRARAYD